jgi:hypothetical protein
MLSMRWLLSVDPLLPLEARKALASRSELARVVLAELGLNDCEASELLDEPRRECGFRGGCLDA